MSFSQADDQGLACTAINMLSKMVRGGNVAYKDDIHKPFSSLS